MAMLQNQQAQQEHFNRTGPIMLNSFNDHPASYHHGPISMKNSEAYKVAKSQRRQPSISNGNQIKPQKKSITIDRDHNVNN